MQSKEKTARPRGTDSAEVISVIKTEAICGSGIDGDPVRTVVQYWLFDGTLVGTMDSICPPGFVPTPTDPFGACQIDSRRFAGYADDDDTGRESA